MKHFGVFLLIMILPLLNRAQQPNPQFYKLVLLSHKPYTLQSITEEIQSQSGISFSYDASQIDPDTRIKLSADRMTVAAILKLIRQRTGIGYKIISRTHIIYTKPVTPKKHKPKPTKRTRKKSNTTQNTSDNTGNTLPDKTIQTNPQRLAPVAIFKDSTTADDIVSIGDSNLVMSYYMPGGGGFSGGGGGGGGNDDDESTTTGEKKKRKTNRYNWDVSEGESDIYFKGQSGTNPVLSYLQSNTLLAFGVAADETYYFAPTLRIGLKYLYGTASYSFGSTNSWRYGIGASAKINEQWRMHFGINTGQSVSKNYDIIRNDTAPAIDPTQPPVITESHRPLTVSSKLNRYSIGANWMARKNLSLEAGLLLNSLKTRYSSNNIPVSLNEILPAGYDADRKYPAIKPPYLLGNSYTGSQTSNTKIWIGLQITVLYVLSFSND